MNRTYARFSLKTSLLLGSAAAVVAASQASAQTVAAAVPETVVITGSRLPVQGLVSPSPVTVLNSSDLKINGITNVEDLLNQLPQVFAAQGSTLSNGTSGTATVNLRNLGANRTLVLVDGKRMQPGDPDLVGADTAAVDINNIPAALVDHVDILTGGESAIYGSDAIAGVINFVMRKDFQGVEFDANWSQAQHDNTNTVARDMIAARGFTQAPAEVFDGRTWNLTGIFGTNTADNRGNITAYLAYVAQRPVLQSQRDFSACSTVTNFDGTFSCLGSSNAAVGHYTPQDQLAGDTLNPNNNKAFAGTTAGTFRPYVGATDAFNFGPYNYLQRPDERYNAGFFAHYDLAPQAELFSNFMFMDDHTIAQIAPSGLFRGKGNDPSGDYLINCDNPLLTAQQQGILCTGLAPTANAIVDIGRRTPEIGPRQDNLRHTSYREVVGVQGDLGSDLHYELYGRYGTTIYQEEYLNDVSLKHAYEGLQVVNNNGTPTCKAALPGGSDPSCVPLNIFTLGQFSPAMASFLSTPGFKEGDNTEQEVGLNITGDFGPYRSPWASNPVEFAVGGDGMRDHLALRTDTEFQTGDLAGQGGPTPSVAGSYSVIEGYTEIGIPLIQDMPFAQEVRLDGSARYSDYTQAGGVWSWDGRASWAPTADAKLRGSIARAVRAPNVIELFEPNSLLLWGGTDPCAGSSPQYTAAQCSLTGVSAAQYGQILQCPSSQCNGLAGGNTALKPEDADTKTLGVVLTPTFLPNFSATIDYYDIKITGLIENIPEATIISGCALGQAPQFCQYIHRAPGSGNIYGNAGYISAQFVNAGLLATDGVDVAANYTQPTGDFGFGDYGALTFHMDGTWLDTYRQQNAPGQEIYNCAGYFGLVCTAGNASAPLPKWRHRMQFGWDSPGNDIGFVVTWRHLNGVKFDANSTDPVLNAPCGGPCADLSEATIPGFDYIDLGARIAVRPGVDLNVGVLNVMDKDPPILDTNNLGVSAPPYGNANTYPQTYDALGRVIFANVTFRY